MSLKSGLPFSVAPATRILTTCKNSIDAQLVRNQLQNEGISSFLVNENFSDLLPNLYGVLGSGVQVMVFEEDFPAAAEIIGLGEKIVCPNCGSQDFYDTLIKKNKLTAFFIILIGNLVGNLLGSYKCNNCGEEFSK